MLHFMDFLKVNPKEHSEEDRQKNRKRYIKHFNEIRDFLLTYKANKFLIFKGQIRQCY